MPIDLYYMDVSPPCRAVQMLAGTLGLSLNLKPLDLLDKKEHLSKEFLKLNPQHCVPTIVDDELVLWESRAIMIYLVEKYGKTDSLYPKDPETRSEINRLLFFDLGTLYNSFVQFVDSVMFEGQEADQKKLDKVYEALEFLEHFLDGHLFAAENHITIADYSLVATIGFMDDININFRKFHRISTWFDRCLHNIPDYDSINREASDKIREMCKGKFSIS